MREVDWKIIITGIICITALEAFALNKGFNGTMLKMTLVIIAGLAGLVIPSPIQVKKEPKVLEVKL